MPVEKSFDKFLFAKRRKITTEQVVVECNVTLESGEELSKVLSVKGCANVDKPNFNGGEISASGKLVLNLIYLTADNLIGSQKSVCPFSLKTQKDASGTVYARSKVIETTVESINASNVKVVSVVEVSLYEIKNEEMKMIASAGENVMTRESETKVTELVSQSTQQFTEENTFTTKERIKSILSSQSDVVIKDSQPGYNFISVQGDVITRLVYVVDDGRDKICSTYITNSFKQEFEVENVSKESSLEVFANVLCEGVLASIEENENETTVKVSVPVEVNMFAYNEKTITNIIDLYSITNEVQTTTESYTFNSIKECDYFESKIEGTMSLGDEYPRVDKLLAVTGEGFVDSNTYISDGEIVIEGVGYATLLYINDELSTINSVQIEFPFSVSEKTNLTDAVTSVNITLTDIDAMVKKGREVFFDAKLKIEVCYYEEETGAVMTDLVLGENLSKRTHPIEIYFAHKGESLWDIAKSLKVKDSLIFEQNCTLTDPLEKDEKIVLYFQKSGKNDINK